MKIEEGAPVVFYHCVTKVVDRNFVLRLRLSVPGACLGLEELQRFVALFYDWRLMYV